MQLEGLGIRYMGALDNYLFCYFLYVYIYIHIYIYMFCLGGGPYYNYSIIYPRTLFYLLRPLHYACCQLFALLST